MFLRAFNGKPWLGAWLPTGYDLNRGFPAYPPEFTGTIFDGEPLGDVGDYHRMLLPGTYDLTFSAGGYLPSTVTDITVTDGPATRIDVAASNCIQGPADSCG